MGDIDNIKDPTARKDQIWEKVKRDTEKFIADAAVLLMGGHSAALVADQFAGMAVRSHPAQMSSVMATLLVMVATDRLESKGLLPEMPPDPFTAEAEQTARDRVEAFVSELTGLTIRHGIAVDTAGQAVREVGTRGKSVGMLQYPALAHHLVWSPELGRYVCESPDGDQPEWKIP
jgi:hypothetical protein